MHILNNIASISWIHIPSTIPFKIIRTFYMCKYMYYVQHRIKDNMHVSVSKF